LPGHVNSNIVWAVSPLGANQCRAVQPARKPCPRSAIASSPYCAEHSGPITDRPYRSRRDALAIWRQSAAAVLRRHESPLAPDIDLHDADTMWAIFTAVLPLYEWYWRVTAGGIENIPTAGPAVLVANHSGALPIDGALLKIATLKEHGRNPWMLAGDIVFRLPQVGGFVRRMGNARADPGETAGLLKDGHLVAVFPEGYQGIGKGWANRYRLEQFGRGGFVKMALQAGAPLLPVGIVGAEQIYPMIANARPVAHALRLPYFPVTPTFPLLGPLGLLPLPAKCHVEFGTPIPTVDYGAESAEDDRLVGELTERARSAVQAMLDARVRRGGRGGS
jgi:1-acyl-sn-glycerol-3-phosphate acyltransferase